MNTLYTSNNQLIKLEITGCDEPNIGRLLHVSNLYIQGKLSNELFHHHWNRLNENLSNYIMNSLNGNFVFIPAEGHSFLLDTQQFNKIELPYKPLSTLTFLANSFTENELIISYTDEKLYFNLIDFSFRNTNN